MDKPLTLVDHLAELRKRIIICLIAFGLATILSLPFSSLLLEVIKKPASELIHKLAFFSPEEPFLIYMRLAFFCGWIISLPVILYQLWAFVSPALEDRLRRYTTYFIFACFSAFILGGLFAYFFLIPPALHFLLSFARDNLEPVLSASKYISFITGLIFASGLVFQMPVLSFILARLGIITSRALRRKYRYAIVIVFVIAAIITPTPDAFNMSLLALPMLLLYEISIWVAYFNQPKRILK